MKILKITYFDKFKEEIGSMLIPVDKEEDNRSVYQKVLKEIENLGSYFELMDYRYI